MKKEIVKFIIVGCSNTLIGVICIYFFYDIVGLGYWFASGIGYIIGSIWSYNMNKRITFQYKKRNRRTIIRFTLNSASCYFLAYAIAKPLTIQLCNLYFQSLSRDMQEEISLFVGVGIYTLSNFIGQKYYCFRAVEE